MLNLGSKSFRAPNAQDVDDLITAADSNGDGKIDYAEFVKVMVEHTGPI